MVLSAAMFLRFIPDIIFLLVGFLLIREEEKQPKISGWVIILLALVDLFFKIKDIISASKTF